MHNIGYETRWGECSARGVSHCGRTDELDIGMARQKKIKRLDMAYKILCKLCNSNKLKRTPTLC